MKALDVVEEILKIVKKEGNVEVDIDVLTENQSNRLNITGIDYLNGKIDITADVEDVKNFKKNFK